MFTGYSKEENQMLQYNLHPERTESDDFGTTDKVATNISVNEVKDAVVETSNFSGGRQFEYNMDVESLW